VARGDASEASAAKMMMIKVSIGGFENLQEASGAKMMMMKVSIGGAENLQETSAEM
jgi:hypothetical protein